MPQEEHKQYFAAAAAGVTFNSPLGEARAADLVRRLAPTRPGWSALDLGCGTAELLLRLCHAHDIGGDGVDQHPGDLDQARHRAGELGVADRLAFHAADATSWDRPAALVLNVGAGHIWGGPAEALTALHRVTGPGGRVLFADAIYQNPPDDRVRELFGDLPDLATQARLAADAGFRPLHVSASTVGEWDDFESDWRAGIERLGTPGARAFADQRREEYLNGYRGVLGFGWLVLTPA